MRVEFRCVECERPYIWGEVDFAQDHYLEAMGFGKVMSFGHCQNCSPKAYDESKKKAKHRWVGPVAGVGYV